MTHSVSLGVHPAHKQADGHSRPGADVEQNGPPVEPVLSFPLRIVQSLFHLLDLLRGAGDPLVAVPLSHAAKATSVSGRAAREQRHAWRTEIIGVTNGARTRTISLEQVHCGRTESPETFADVWRPLLDHLARHHAESGQ